MIKRRIVPIVEGHGEERAIPCLMRRWLRYRGFCKFFEVPGLAINAKGCGKLKAPYDRLRHIGIEHYVEAALRNKPDAILIVIDADEECLNRDPSNGLGPKLVSRAKDVAGTIPLGVVVANREYEAWFLASITSIRAAGLFPNRINVNGNFNPELPRDCKGIIASLMGCPYEETIHQLKLTERLTFSPKAKYRSPSYGKFQRDLERLTREVRKRALG